MKKILICLIVALMLAGCGEERVDKTEDTGFVEEIKVQEIKVQEIVIR